MSKVKYLFKNHFVEVMGFVAILVIIILISYLKMFKKTFTCEMKSSEDNVKVYQKYVVKQSNNKLKKISYYYEATSPDKKTRNKISEFYNDMISKKKDALSDNDITLTYKDNKLVLKYDLTEFDKDNDSYKSAKAFIKSAKAVGFKCK